MTVPAPSRALQLHSQDGVQLRLGLGPDLRTAGLWKPVRLERWSVARLARVIPLVTLDTAGTGWVELRIDLERLDSEAPLTVTAEILGHRAEGVVDAGATGATLVVNVPDAPVCGLSATAGSRWLTSRSRYRQSTRNLTGGSGESGSARSNWIPLAMTSAPHSPFRSTANRCSSKASTGSQMITS